VRGLRRREPGPGQHAREKLLRKGVPLIVGNLGPATFGRDDNTLVLVDARGERELPTATSWRWRANWCARSPSRHRLNVAPAR
jgi:hypothetical protein